MPEERGEDDAVVRRAQNRNDPAVLKKKFKELCSPRRNVIMERHMFNSRNQQSGEPFNAFVSDLRIKATTCEYGELKDELIRDRIVTGITKNNVRKQLLKEADLTLVKAIQVCQVNELSEQQLDQLGQAQKLDQSDTEVHKVNI